MLDVKLGQLSIPRDTTRLATLLGIALYVTVSLLYLALGQVNSDEGWYLYASKLVFQGALPYRDFAYTQMPLLPYIYGVWQVAQPSVVLGRLTSALLSLGTLGMAIAIARRYGGSQAGAIVALLLAAFTFGIYFNSIVKTYALVSFLFTATLFVLCSDMKDQVKYPLALCYAFLAALVRITAVFFAVPILLYCWVAGTRPRVRTLVGLETLAVCIVTAGFLTPDWDAARWNLIDSHLRHWGTSPIADRVRDIIAARLPDIVQAFGPALVLCSASLVYILYSQTSRTWWRERKALVACAAGLLLFAASHLANGIWDVEYLIPSLTLLLLLLAIALGQFYTESERTARQFIQGALAAVLLIMPLGEATQHTDLTGGRLPLVETSQVSAAVAQNCSLEDRVLALEALDVALDANCQVLPGMTLGKFSLQDVSTLTARQLHLVNYELVVEAIDEKAAGVILLTDGDWDRLREAAPPGSDSLERALGQNYRPTYSMTQYGQPSQNIVVYVRRDRGER